MRSFLLLIIPLVSVLKAMAIGDTTAWQINHQFTLLYGNINRGMHEGVQLRGDDSRRNNESSTHLILELRAYLNQNFGLTSLAGYGTLPLPTDPGTYDTLVKVWKPIADASIGETRARMHDFYLGACLSEIGPLDPVPTSENERRIAEAADATLFSKGGLLTDYSGNVYVRITVSRLSWRRQSSEWKKVEHQQHRVKMRETVDEVLSRVRRNKRGRMSRVYTNSSVLPVSSLTAELAKSKHDGDVTTNAETNNISKDKVSYRTAEVLERVRSRKPSAEDPCIGRNICRHPSE